MLQCSTVAECLLFHCVCVCALLCSRRLRYVSHSQKDNENVECVRLLILCLVIQLFPGPPLESGIHKAAKCGDTARVTALLERGEPVDSRSEMVCPDLCCCNAFVEFFMFILVSLCQYYFTVTDNLFSFPPLFSMVNLPSYWLLGVATQPLWRLYWHMGLT